MADDIDPNGPPIRIDRRPRDDDGTPFDVPMRKRVGSEAWAPKLPPRYDQTSLDALLARYGTVNLSDALTNRTSDNFEDRRGQPVPEFYPTTPENPTRPGTFNQLDDKRDQLVDALLRKYNVPPEQSWGGLKSYIPQEWRNQADSMRTQIRDAIPPAVWLALSGIRAPMPSLPNLKDILIARRLGGLPEAPPWRKLPEVGESGMWDAAQPVRYPELKYQERFGAFGNPEKPVEAGPIPAGEYTMDQLPPHFRRAFDLMNRIYQGRKNEPPPNLTAIQGSNPIPVQYRGMAPESPVQRGMRDDTGPWFLEGDKPVYASSSRKALDQLYGPDYAKRFDAYKRYDITDADGNPHAYWVKPNLAPEQAQALNDLARFKRTFSPTRATPAEVDQHHRLQGRAFGYPQEAIDAYLQKPE